MEASGYVSTNIQSLESRNDCISSNRTTQLEIPKNLRAESLFPPPLSLQFTKREETSYSSLSSNFIPILSTEAHYYPSGNLIFRLAIQLMRFVYDDLGNKLSLAYPTFSFCFETMKQLFCVTGKTMLGFCKAGLVEA